MTISLRSAGAAAAGSTSLSIPYPGTISAGDLLVVAICSKYPTYGPADISGWTKLTSDSSFGTSGTDTGDTRATIFYKVAAGTESGNLSVTLTSCNTCVGRMFSYRRTVGSGWDVAYATGTQNTKVDPWTSTNAVTAASNPGLTDGDVLLVVVAHNVNVCTAASEAVTAAGVTAWGTMVEQQDSGTNNGDDCSLIVTEHPVSTGTSSAAPVYSQDPSTTVSGGVLFLRMRESTNNYTDTGTVEAAGTVSAAELTTRVDTGTVTGDGTVSAADLFAAVDVGTAEAAGTVSAEEVYTPTGTHTEDTGTVTGDGTVSAAELLTMVDTGTATGDGTVSAAELLTMVDTGTATGDGTVSAADLMTGLDTGTVEAAGTVSAADLMTGLDTGTVTGDGTVSADEVYTPAGGTSYTDTGTVEAACTVSAAELTTRVDTGTAEAAGTVSAAELLTLVDTGTAEAAGTVTAAELLTAVDTGTAEGTGTVSAVEVYTPVAAGMRLVVTGDPSPDVRTPDTGEPAGKYNGYDYWMWTTDAGTWYLWMFPSSPHLYALITQELGVIPQYEGPPGWRSNFRYHIEDYPFASYLAEFGSGATGTVIVGEYVPPVAAVVTNILLGSTVETCRILNSRIVRGPI